MNAERVDLLIRYALAIAAQNEEWAQRELGPIHLLKYVYIGDLAHAARHNGITFTGADWRFYKFGPWSNAVHERIRPAVQRLHVNERRFEFSRGDGEDGEGVRWKLADEPDRLIAESEKELPGVLASFVRKAVRAFGGDTSELLHHVYRTLPMVHAAPDEPLEFSHAVLEPVPQFEKPPELTSKQQKKLREAIRALKEKLKAQPKPRYVAVDPPLHDEIYEEGVRALDRDGGDALMTVEGVVTFSNEMWKSKGRHDGGIP
jgi:hypothetical protein